jgi:hypothetical protein
MVSRISRDIKEAYHQKEKEKKKKKTWHKLSTSCNSRIDHHPWQHLDCISDSPTIMPLWRKQCTNVVVVRSNHKLRHVFTPEEDRAPKQCLQQGNNQKTTITRYNQWRSDLVFSPWNLILGVWEHHQKRSFHVMAPPLSKILLQNTIHRAHSQHVNSLGNRIRKPTTPSNRK